MKFEFKISAETVEFTLDSLHQFYGLILHENQLYEFLKKDIKIAAELSIASCDTYVRERIAEIISKELCGLKWPNYGDPKEYHEEFDSKFMLAAIENEIKLSHEWTKQAPKEVLDKIENKKSKIKQSTSEYNRDDDYANLEI